MKDGCDMRGATERQIARKREKERIEKTREREMGEGEYEEKGKVERSEREWIRA